MKPVSRRHFVAASTLGATALTQLSTRSAETGGRPDRNIHLGLIGCGWYGMVDVNAAYKVGGVEVTGLCDVDEEHLSKSAAEIEKREGRRPRTFKHHADLLAMDELDAVIIASPPQWHALHLLASLDRKLDVYCEKPLAYDVRECQAMAQAVKASGRIVQIGFQRRQSPAFRAVREYLQSGDAGEIICAEANIHYTAGTKDPTPVDPPASLDWDLWCGPAPKIPYSPQVGHMNWRLERTTGHGHLVDWGIHLIDAARLILGEGAPRTVTSSGGLYALEGKITTPDVLTAHFEFARCPLTWRHRIWGAQEYTPETSNGLFFYGEKETIFVTDDRWEVIPKGRGKERRVHEAKADMGQLQMAEFLTAARQRKAPGCPIEEGVLSTTAVKLAMISYEVGARVTWDASTEAVTANARAESLLKREYRAPYRHPYGG